MYVNTRTISKSQNSFYSLLLLIVSLAAIGQLTNTITVPAMHQIGRSFSVTAGHVQEVIAFYLFPYGLLQFVYGPISDCWGRRPIICIGIIAFIIGSLMAIFANSFSVLLAASAMQGCGIAVGGVMARTLLRDCYSGLELKSASSYVSMAMIVAPLLAPLIGGWLTDYYSWRIIYVFLFIYAAVVLVLYLCFFSETNQYINNRSSVFLRYKTVLRSKPFLINMIYLLVVLSGVSLFESYCGALFTGVMHLSAGLSSFLFVVPLPAYMLGSFLSARLAKKHHASHVLNMGLLLLAVGALLMLILAVLGYVKVWAILAPAALYLLGSGFVFPIATAEALEEFPDLAGTAGAVLGGVQNIGSGIIIAAAAMLPLHNQLPLAVILVLLSGLVIVLNRYRAGH